MRSEASFFEDDIAVDTDREQKEVSGSLPLMYSPAPLTSGIADPDQGMAKANYTVEQIRQQLKLEPLPQRIDSLLRLKDIIHSSYLLSEREEQKVKKRPKISRRNNETTEPIHSEKNTGNTIEIKIEDETSTGDGRHGWENTGRSREINHRVDLEWIFIIANFALEFPSAVFDQLSSVQKPQYALVGMLLSFAAVVVCIAELNYKFRKERVAWMWRHTLPWFYYPSESLKPFGSFKDIFGLGCAFCQSIVTTINYVFCVKYVNNPINISFGPIVFALSLLCSKLLSG